MEHRAGLGDIACRLQFTFGLEPIVQVVPVFTAALYVEFEGAPSNVVQ